MQELIMVVDDNPINLKFCYELLACEDYTVIKAHDAEVALRILETRLPDFDGYRTPRD